MALLNDTQADITRVCDKVKNLLLEKNKKYGDSALEPVRVFSQDHQIAQLKVRIDDKLSRIRTSGPMASDEDTLLDLMGYLVLLKIALERDTAECYNKSDYEY